MALTAMQALSIKYLASGWTVTKVAAHLKIGAHIIQKWKNHDEEFKEALARGIENHAEIVEALLLEGEARGAETLLAALNAEGKNGPNWNARISAALSLLDRAGTRGRAVEKQLAVQANMGAAALGAGVNVEESLRKALRDPGVRAWLKQTGALETMIMGAEDVEVITEPATPDTPAASAPLLLSPPDVEVA